MTREEYELLPRELVGDVEEGFTYVPESMQVKKPEVGSMVPIMRVSKVDKSGRFPELSIVLETDVISE